jgi:NAD(P)-dependent dehydrogenase (short-subunit alcohol dehydrogenase family)
MLKVAFVTGAGEGIGAAVALGFAQAGYAVAVNDLDIEKAEVVADEIQAGGGQALALGGDISDVQRVRAMMRTAFETFGRLDVAVANAGVTLYGDFFDYTPEALDRVMGVNLRGTFFTAQAAARYMRNADGGRIVLMSSVTGHQAVKYLAAYGMTKAALEMLAKNLVIELSPYNITINTVAPGATLTPRNLTDDVDYVASWSEVIPLGQVAQPEDIARAVLFLASDAARFITGQTIVVDGGWTATSPTPGIRFRKRDGDT